MTLTSPGKASSIRMIAMVLALQGGFAVVPVVHAQNVDATQNATPGHRKIPAAARLGQAQMQQQNVLSIDGTAWLMSPGATVRDDRNMLTNINALYQVRAVRYTANPQGMLDKVWILSADESTDEALDNAGVERPNLIRDTVRGVLNTLF